MAHNPRLPANVIEAPSEAEAAVRLGRHLGLDVPAPLAATRRALKEPLFARALIAAQRMPEIRDALLKGTLGTPAGQLEAVGDAVGAALKWGEAGMRPTKPWIISRRLEACTDCPFNSPAPETLIYRGAAFVAGKSSRICSLCGCLINTKAALSTELCPARDPDRPKLSRWGDPWVAPENHAPGPW